MIEKIGHSPESLLYRDINKNILLLYKGGMYFACNDNMNLLFLYRAHYTDMEELMDEAFCINSQE